MEVPWDIFLAGSDLSMYFLNPQEFFMLMNRSGLRLVFFFFPPFKILPVVNVLCSSPRICARSHTIQLSVAEGAGLNTGFPLAGITDAPYSWTSGEAVSITAHFATHCFIYPSLFPIHFLLISPPPP